MNIFEKSESIRRAAHGQSLGMIGLIARLREHLVLAEAGDRSRESRLINRICQIRASAEFNSLAPEVRGMVKRGVDFLRSTGRKVNLQSPNQIDWVSQRDGSPRW